MLLVLERQTITLALSIMSRHITDPKLCGHQISSYLTPPWGRPMIVEDKIPGNWDMARKQAGVCDVDLIMGLVMDYTRPKRYIITVDVGISAWGSIWGRLFEHGKGESWDF
ncbi:hypothetical protein RRF57_006265 [Xylaria bambusicola]|uniref:Uncharacterized protein n=1 Tax=Xylaria bambusicola TaxID=326684 RepID=A0AAN7UE10_9PEZI